jgi:hypothetical protein
MDGGAGNQLGNVGIFYPNALGDQFALSQANGNNQGGAGSNVFSTVTLTQSGDLIFAEPGDSSVNIGQTTTGQNVQYISQMAGTTMINSPALINGNVAIPHQYTFSMNPENNPTLPTATINANVTVGGAGAVALGSVGTPLATFGVDSQIVGITGNTVDLQGSNSYVQIDQTNPGVEVVSQSGNVGISAAGLINNTANNFFVSSANTLLSADSVFSVSTNQGSININAASNVNINSSGSNVNIESYYITNVKGSDVNVIADTGFSAFNTPIINMKAQNGPLGGLINIESFASYGEVAGYGHVVINAHGSSNGAVPIGGLININAYSAGVGDFGGATSAIRLNAATVGINAGALPPFLSLAGSAVVYGNNIVSICAGAPAILPQIPLTTYIYGTGGVRLDCGLGARITTLGILQAPDVELDIVRANSNAGYGVYFADPITANVITPQPSPFVPNGGGDLYIRGSNIPFQNSYVQLQDIGSLAFATALASNVTGSITGLSTINGQGVGAYGGSSWSLYNQISSLSSITAVVGVLSTLNVSTVNGQVIQPWYNVPAAGPVSMANNSINNASYIITSNLYSGQLNGLYEGAAQGTLAINTTSSLTMASASSITIQAPKVSISTLSSINGAPYINTQDWALSEAVANIDAAGNNVGNVGTVFTNNISITNDFTMVNNGNVANFGSNALTNVSSINGYQFPQTAIVGDTIVTSSLTVSSIKAISGGVVNMAGVTINQLNGLFTNSINTPVITGTGYPGPLEIYDLSGVILGGLTVPVSLIGLSSINGAAYPIKTQTADTFVVSSITVSSINAISGGVVNMSNTTINQLAGLFSQSVNTPTLTNVGGAGTPLSIYDTDGVIVGAGAGPVSIFNLSSINGVPYSGGSAWNGNATSALNMNGNSISGATTIGASGQISANNFNTASVAVNPTSITIGGTSLDGGGLGANGITLASYANIPALQAVQSINGESYVNPFKIVAPNFAVPYSGYTVTINTGNLAGYWYFTGASDITIHIQFQAPAPPAGGSGYYFNGSFGGRYTFFNQNPVNNMYIYASVYYIGPDYPAGTIQINPREGLTLEVVPYGASSSYPSSSQASWNKIGFIHYEKVGPIVPAS